ncbi:MAG: transcriptional regulator [Chloroflexi bacterium]|nr:transcriptional regulator [Chloroflexota bacterium]
MVRATTDSILDLAREVGVIRPRDLEAAGIPGSYLSRLAHTGELDRVGRGLYTLAGASPTEHRSLAEVAKRVPRGVICLLSALRFHELTTQAPFEVWLAIGQKDRTPRPNGTRLRIVRVSGDSRDAGVETHVVEGVPVRIYGVAKTVADCFKFRNKIGVDVAFEALRDCLEQRRCTTDELSEYARVCRVSRVMQPYMEALA